MTTRDIKFRGMTIEGELVYGFVRENANPNMKYRGWFIADNMHSPLAFEVRPETIGQYTGLKDKNGLEIYESDILSVGILNQEGKVWMKREAVMVWDTYGFQLDYSRSRIENERGLLLCDLNIHQKEFEVIGNIYSNPELINNNL